MIYQCIVSLNSKFIFYCLLYKKWTWTFKLFATWRKALSVKGELEILKSYSKGEGRGFASWIQCVHLTGFCRAGGFPSAWLLQHTEQPSHLAPVAQAASQGLVPAVSPAVHGAQAGQVTITSTCSHPQVYSYLWTAFPDSLEVDLQQVLPAQPPQLISLPFNKLQLCFLRQGLNSSLEKFLVRHFFIP